MKIRPLLPSDFDEVLSMMLPFYASEALLIHSSEETLRKTLTDALSESPYLEAYGFDVEGQLVGYSMLAKSYSTEAGGKCIWIEDIYIKPAYRGLGFGTQLLHFVEDTYRGKVARIRIEAEPENQRAMAVYHKAGYEELGYTQLVKELPL